MRKVISHKNLPKKSPILATVVYVLAMDYWNAPQWFIGAFGLLLVFIWLSWLYSIFNQDEIDIMSNTDKKPERKSTFKEKINEAKKET